MPSNKSNQEESIYNLVPRPQVIPPKPPRFLTVLNKTFFLLSLISKNNQNKFKI